MRAALVVQRRELGQLVYLVDDVLVDEDRAVEVLAALNDAVPHGVDLVEGVDGLRRARRERFQYERHGVVVVGHLGVDDLLVLVEAVLVEGLRRAHALADALRETARAAPTFTSWYFKEDDPALITRTFNDLPPFGLNS